MSSGIHTIVDSLTNLSIQIASCQDPFYSQSKTQIEILSRKHLKIGEGQLNARGFKKYPLIECFILHF